MFLVVLGDGDGPWRGALGACSAHRPRRQNEPPLPLGMKRTQWEHKRSRLLYRRLAQPLQSSGGRGWRARMYELGGAKQAGSTYAHGGPPGNRGRSLRAHRPFFIPRLGSWRGMAFLQCRKARPALAFVFRTLRCTTGARPSPATSARRPGTQTPQTLVPPVPPTGPIALGAGGTN